MMDFLNLPLVEGLNLVGLGDSPSISPLTPLILLTKQ